MVNRDSEIVSKILSMDPAERDEFMSKLKPDTLDYLDNLLRKVSEGYNTAKFKRYLQNNI